ncbi:YggS family pyridoxal phosphate-dependent enzyme [bacterium]|nr:YggS family pyridoxal phosphate-dependent enzyme [bacterium]
MVNKVRERLLQIQQEIAPSQPKIIAITKYFDEIRLIEAYEAGLRDFGENRVVDALNKFAKLPKEIIETSMFHLVGHLQTNKVKKAVGNFDYIHSVDSLKLLETIDTEAKSKGIVQKILIQVNNANEVQKYGLSIDKVVDLFSGICSYTNCEVVGLMNIAPLDASENELQRLFGQIRELKEELEKTFNLNLRELSMGMSNDYKIAVQNGSTMLRIGRKLFT